MKQHTVTGTVIHGEHAGRTIGFPSANFDTKLLDDTVKLGVHLAQAEIAGKKYFGLAYFGPRYVHGELHNLFEIFFYDFSGELYGQTLTVELLQFMRPPQKWETMEQVQEQLTKDKAAGVELIKKIEKR